MKKTVRIALIHATRVAIAPIEEAAKKHWPEAEMFSILEEALSADRATDRVPVDQLNDRIVTLARYAEQLDPAGILYTCSAFGDGIETAASTSPLPVLKPNEAMFEEALEHGNNIAMLYTFPASVEGMEKEFYTEATNRNSNASIHSVFAQGAREALSAGDIDTHNKIIAETATTITGADAILLAHFSMAPAANSVRASVSMPVLSSPESAIRKMKLQVGSVQ